jgi:alpha-galactosidase
MWAVMASPLIISANIRNMSKMNVETYTNSEVIAVDQDELGIQGERIMGGALSEGLARPGGHRDGEPMILQSCNATKRGQIWAMGGHVGLSRHATL